MSTREELISELRRIEGSYVREITKEKTTRARAIIRILCKCICRHCGKEYDNQKARGEFKGFCSAKCQHTRAKQLGYKKSNKPASLTEYQVLSQHKCIGDQFVTL